ncbi:MAG: DegV family protein [Chloroflexi bacterium]|nr:DegV family protein [Chloroflexota bacterium]
MKPLRVVTDSTSDLPPELAQRYGIVMVPVWVHFGTESYRDGVDIDQAQFYQRLEQRLPKAGYPTTSQPSPGQFAQVYRQLAQEGFSILSIHVTAKTSGTYQSAVLGRSLVPEAEVTVVDSASISLGLGYACLAAARAIQQGRSLEDGLHLIEEIKARTRIFGAVDRLDFLRASGRVTHLQSVLASLLDVKPIITVRQGVVEMIDRVRTRKRSLARLLELMESSLGRGARIVGAVLHANVPQEAEWLRAEMARRFDCQELILGPAGLALAANAGPGLVGILGYRTDGLPD